jgi:hypothetical protein
VVRLLAVAAVALALAPVASGAGGEVAAVRSYLTPGPYFFGDQVTATLDVIVRTDAVDTDSVHVDTKFTPYERIGAPQRSEQRDGPVLRIRYRYLLACDSLACAGNGKTERRFTLPPARVRYRDVHGHKHARPVRWPFVRLVSRLGRTDKITGSEATIEVQFAGNPADRLRASVVAATPSVRLSPWLLASLLFAFALASLVGAGAVGRPLLALVRRDAETVELSPLERALDAVDAAAQKQAGGAEHREALAALARALRPIGSPELVRRARRLAWAEQPPSGADSRALTDDVRREV